MIALIIKEFKCYGEMSKNQIYIKGILVRRGRGGGGKPPCKVLN